MTSRAFTEQDPDRLVAVADLPDADAPVRTSIVVADDHAAVRNGLRMLLDTEEGLDVVAEAGDLSTALRCVRAHRPRVLVLDLNMAGQRSLPAIPSFIEASPETHIVVLTMHNDPAFARQAFRAGALGYVLTEAADTELVDAVLLAAVGRTYINPELGARVTER